MRIQLILLAPLVLGEYRLRCGDLLSAYPTPEAAVGVPIQELTRVILGEERFLDILRGATENDHEYATAVEGEIAKMLISYQEAKVLKYAVLVEVVIPQLSSQRNGLGGFINGAFEVCLRRLASNVPVTGNLIEKLN